MALPYVEMTGVSAIGIDWTFPRMIARETLQRRMPVREMSIPWPCSLEVRHSTERLTMS